MAKGSKECIVWCRYLSDISHWPGEGLVFNRQELQEENETLAALWKGWWVNLHLPIARPLRTRSWLSDTDCRVSACSYSRSFWMCQTWWSCSRCAEELLFFVWFPWPLHRCLHSWTLELHGFGLLMRCLCSRQIPNLCQKHASFGGFQCPIPLTQECEDARSKLSDVRNRVEASRFQFLEPNCFRKERVLSGLLIRALKQPC